MPTKKYDWIKLKQEYFESNAMEVRQFLSKDKAFALNVIKSGIFTKNTTGWTEEKMNFKKLMAQKATEKLANDPNIEIHTKRLLTALTNLESKISILVGQPNVDIEIDDIPKMKVAYDMLRLATGKSTTNQGGDKSNPIDINTKLQIEFINARED